MGPESTPESCLKQAMACIQKAIHGISLENGSASPELHKDLGGSDVICKLAEITGTLERCMETQKLVNDLASGKMVSPSSEFLIVPLREWLVSKTTNRIRRY